MASIPAFTLRLEIQSFNSSTRLSIETLKMFSMQYSCLKICKWSGAFDIGVICILYMPPISTLYRWHLYIIDATNINLAYVSFVYIIVYLQILAFVYYRCHLYINLVYVAFVYYRCHLYQPCICVICIYYSIFIDTTYINLVQVAFVYYRCHLYQPCIGGICILQMPPISTLYRWHKT